VRALPMETLAPAANAIEPHEIEQMPAFIDDGDVAAAPVCLCVSSSRFGDLPAPSIVKQCGVYPPRIWRQG